MKRIITLITLVLVSASTLMYAQSSSETRQAERKAQREAQKAREKAENERNYAIAVQALKEGKFVLEADQLVFKRGRSAFVSSTTNFVLMDGEHASVQIAANNALAVQRNRRHHSGRQQKGNENHDRQKGKRELQLQRTRHRNIRTSVYHTDQRRQ